MHCAVGTAFTIHAVHQPPSGPQLGPLNLIRRKQSPENKTKRVPAQRADRTLHVEQARPAWPANLLFEDFLAVPPPTHARQSWRSERLSQIQQCRRGTARDVVADEEEDVAQQREEDGHGCHTGAASLLAVVWHGIRMSLQCAYGPKNSYPCSCSASLTADRRTRASGERLGSGLAETVAGASVFFTLAARARLGAILVT